MSEETERKEEENKEIDKDKKFEDVVEDHSIVFQLFGRCDGFV